MNTVEDLEAFARSLLVDGAPEIALRSAASRIYYAAYHLCTLQANKCCTPLQDEDKNGGLHLQLFTRLIQNSKKKDFDEALATLAETAKKMKAIRVDADYKLAKDFISREARRCASFLDDVKQLCQELDGIIAGSPPSA